MNAKIANPVGSISTLLRIVAPVVVKPDVDSKKALIKLSIEPVNIKGKAPKIDAVNHVRATTKKPSLILSLFLLTSIFLMINIPIITMGINNFIKAIATSYSSYISDTITDGIIDIPNIVSIAPIILMMAFKLSPIDYLSSEFPYRSGSQNLAVNSNNTVNISKRPAIIKNDKYSFIGPEKKL
jgi:hypothetical protein